MHATTPGVTIVSGDSATGRTAGDAVVDADGPDGGSGTELTEGPGGWPSVRDDSDIQFEPIQLPEADPNPPPNWFIDFLEWLGNLLEPIARLFGASWFIIKWVLLAIAVAAILYLLFRLLAPLTDWRPRKRAKRVDEEDWTPDREEAVALLEDADRLAEQGLYDEATHLLLKRSVTQISDARPDWVEPSSTARELAALPALPDKARNAFRIIAERVERSLFALRKLGQDDWQAARAAYADFALERF